MGTYGASLNFMAVGSRLNMATYAKKESQNPNPTGIGFGITKDLNARQLQGQQQKLTTAQQLAAGQKNKELALNNGTPPISSGAHTPLSMAGVHNAALPMTKKNPVTNKEK